MKNKIVLAVTLIIAVLLAGAAFYFYQQSASLADKLAQAIAQNQPPASGMKMSVVTIAQSDSFYNIKAEYPQIDGADAAFNQKIASTITGLVDTFKKDAKDNWDARNATLLPGQTPQQTPSQPFDFLATINPGQFDPRYASFAIDVYYFSGGAHGIDQIFAFNYDLQNKKEITIADFVGGQAGLDKLAQMAQSQIASQLEANGVPVDQSIQQMIAAGTGATADNFRNFTFGFGKLTLYFEQYQVAPGAAGTITVTFYKNDLEQNSINPAYLD